MLRTHYPLRWHLASLFAALVLVAGGLIGFYNQQLLREQLLQATRLQAAQIAERTGTRAESLLRPVEAGLTVLARTRLLAIPRDLDDAEMREMLRTLLDLEPQLAAVFVGDGKGRFYILRALRDDAGRARLQAPAEAHYLAQHIHEPGSQARRTVLDASLRTLATQADPEYAARFDPRTRPWYHQAQQQGGMARTPVYRFFATQQLGITLALPSLDTPDLVIGADLTLAALSEQLSAQRFTPGHRLALVDEKDALLAVAPASLGLADFEAARRGGDEDWLGERLPLGLGMQLLTQVPREDLQAQAREAVQRSTLVTVLLVLASVPLTLWLARRVAQPLQQLARQAQAIRRFEFDEPQPLATRISEVARLDEAMGSMRRAIRRFVEMTEALAAETDFERLQDSLLRQILPAVDARLGVLYLEQDGALPARCAQRTDRHALPPQLPALQDCLGSPLVQAALHGDRTLGGRLDAQELASLGLAALQPPLELGGGIVVPLHNRRRERIGALLLLCEGEPLPSRVRFAEAVAASAATAIETRELIQAQRQLFEAFIELIAAAIDAKSPYTGGHCARVPQLTKMLAEAACAAREGPFADFQLDAQEWEALHVAAWLHDCGKVTTPDYVVDKATKLETIYNRIHELRMRFEVLKRDAEIAHLQRLLRGEPDSAAQRDRECRELDEEFAFVARCNVGGEQMAEADRARLRSIAARRWLRTLDDRLGLSQEEQRRLQDLPAAPLPHWEPLLADKPEHRIARSTEDPALQPSNCWGFQLDVPPLLYDRGELTNLAVSRGTLSQEERFKINEHIVQTIVMLSKLPYPRHLRAVPEIAGGHHEKMDGTGYPRRLRQHEMSLPARMMAIADIFEALTAADRPYKPAKTLSESLGLMARMAADAHIDRPLFELFLRAGVAQRYAAEHMDASLVDPVDVEALLQAAGAADGPKP